MTDKQIIIYKKECYNEPHCSLNQVLEQLEAYKMEADEGKEINAELKAELEQEKAWHKTSDEISKVNSEYTEKLKAENEELKFQNKRLDEVASYWHKRIFKVERSERKLKQTLTEIKPILEFYANSKMGEEQPDRTYKIMCSGGYIMAYDPKPARQALQKISEYEGNDENL